MTSNYPSNTDSSMIDPDHPIHQEPPLTQEKRRVPFVVQREVRKFALEQAVKALPGLRAGMAIVDVAKEFEKYILGEADD